jgi:hypothetical protein
MQTYTISGINSLTDAEKRGIFLPLIPAGLFERFSLPADLIDQDGNSLIVFSGHPGGQGMELFIYHQHGFKDPILYSHLTDTLLNQIHVLLYIMSDPTSPRYDIDVMPNGTETDFGTSNRNLTAEAAAMNAGLLPGQIRKGFNLLSEAVNSFEDFVLSLKHTMYFLEPLYYHNAIIFERYGFKYQTGKKKMEKIHQSFSEDQLLLAKLDGSQFRKPEAKNSIFFRSWAIHDGILGEPFSNLTMYKVLGQKDQINTAPDIPWI